MKLRLPALWLFPLSTLLATSLVQAVSWQFTFDLSHGKITNEGTRDTVDTFFWSRLGSREECPDTSRGSKTYFPQHDEVLCLEHHRSRTADLLEGRVYTQNLYLLSDVEIVAIVMAISGEDAMYVDQAYLEQDDSVVASWGAHEGKGWCMSTRKNDATSWYDYLGTNTCSSFILWDATNNQATRCASNEVCAFEALFLPDNRWYHKGFDTPATVQYDHYGETLSSSTLSSKAPMANKGFRMNSDDDYTRDWRPQGIAGFKYDGRDYIVVSWYHRTVPPVKGSRITLHDVSTSPIPYRHILLVDENLAPVRNDWKAGGCAYRDGNIHCIDDGNPQKQAHVFPVAEIENVDSTAGYDYSYVIRRSYFYIVPSGHGDYMSAAYDLGANWFLYGDFKFCNGSVGFHADKIMDQCGGRTDGAIGFYNPSRGIRMNCDGPFLEDMQGVVYFEKDGHHIMVASSSYKGNKTVSHLHAFEFNPNQNCNGGSSWNNLAYTPIHLPAGSEDLYAEDGGDHVWTVTEFGDHPDCYDGKNNREVLRYSKEDLKNAALGNANYEFVVNFKHKSIKNEHTGSKTCAHFYSQKGTRSQCPQSPINAGTRDYCYEGSACLDSIGTDDGNAHYILPNQPDRPISTVILRTYGHDALFVDYCWLKNDLLSHNLITWGRNNGNGWCLSLDANDWAGSWEKFVDAKDCSQSIIYNMEEDTNQGGLGSWYNCPSSIGNCSNTTLFEHLLALP